MARLEAWLSARFISRRKRVRHYGKVWGGGVGVEGGGGRGGGAGGRAQCTMEGHKVGGPLNFMGWWGAAGRMTAADG
jgi:hypothetical protein